MKIYISQIIFVLILISTIIIFAFFNHSLDLCSLIIHDSIFESLIQVYAIIIGFSIVGIIFYFGKFHESKDDNLKRLLELRLEYDIPQGLVEQYLTHLQDLYREIDKTLKKYILELLVWNGFGILLSFLGLILNHNPYPVCHWPLIFFSIILMTINGYVNIRFWHEIPFYKDLIDEMKSNFIKNYEGS